MSGSTVFKRNKYIALSHVQLITSDDDSMASTMVLMAVRRKIMVEGDQTGGDVDTGDDLTLLANFGSIARTSSKTLCTGFFDVLSSDACFLSLTFSV